MKHTLVPDNKVCLGSSPRNQLFHMTLDSIITEKTVSKLEEEKNSDGESFVVLSYDFPSEKTSYSDLEGDEEQELLKSLKTKRQTLQRQFSLLGVQLSHSTYIVHVEHASTLISKVEHTYSSGLNGHQDMVSSQVRLHIVGTSYQNVVKDLLEETLEQGLEEVEQTLDSIDMRIEQGDQVQKEELYRESSKIDRLENRAEDMYMVDESLGEDYLDKVEKLSDEREELISSA